MILFHTNSTSSSILLSCLFDLSTIEVLIKTDNVEHKLAVVPLINAWKIGSVSSTVVLLWTGKTLSEEDGTAYEFNSRGTNCMNKQCKIKGVPARKFTILRSKAIA